MYRKVSGFRGNVDCPIFASVQPMTPQPPLKHPTLPPNTRPGPPPPPPVLLLGHNVQHILYSLYVSALNTLQCSVMKSKIICSSAQYAKQVPHCNGPCFRRYRPQWQMHQLQGAPLHQQGSSSPLHQLSWVIFAPLHKLVPA